MPFNPGVTADASCNLILARTPSRWNANPTGFSPDRLQEIAHGAKGVVDALLAVCEIQRRPYQARLIESAVRILGGASFEHGAPQQDTVSSLLIESPTGSGKTAMGLAIANILQRCTNARVGWLATQPRRMAHAEAENKASRFGIKLQTINLSDPNPPNVDLLVIDQVQHDIANSIPCLQRKIQSSWTLGLASSSHRTDRIKHCFDRVIREAGVASLINDGYLSRFDHYALPDFAPQRIANQLISAPKRWGKSMVFFNRRSECDLLLLLLRQAGIPASIVTSDSDHGKQIDDFCAHRLNVLINMSIKTPGFDQAELQTVFCRPGGKGCTLQMTDRVLRTCRRVPVKQIVQCETSPYVFSQTAAPLKQYLWIENRWQCTDASNRTNELNNTASGLFPNAYTQTPVASR